MPLDIAPFQARRAQLLATMQAAGGGVAIIPTAPERFRNRDTTYAYRFDSYFYYLTAFREPEAVLVLVAGDTPKSILFCRTKDMEREIWDGYRFGPDAAREAFGFDEARPIAELDEQLGTLLANQPAVFHSVGYEPDWDRRVADALNRVRAQARTGCHAPGQIRDVRSLID
ncbi:MAG TPA: aminopeptidase P N-terminal domain-containing protein, partial [Zoogloea sp.]|nr:aminopeptidase P N-terminal domain-containing protein [Zoogloea sp.]